MVAALRSPLRLFLAVTGYRRADRGPSMLTQYDTTTELDDHLFGLLVPAVTAQHPRPTGGHYPAADVQRWLTTLARHLHRQGTAGGSSTDLRLDELWPAAGEHAPRYLTAALLTIIQLALLTSSYRQVEPLWDLPIALGMAWLLGLVIWTLWGSSRRSVELARIDLGALRTTAGRRRLASGLMFWLAAVLAGGLAAWLAVGIAVLLVTGFTVGFTGRITARPVAIDLPRRVVSQGLAHTAAWLTAGLMGGHRQLGQMGVPGKIADCGQCSVVRGVPLPG